MPTSEPNTLEPLRYKLRVVHPSGVVYAEAWDFDDEVPRELERIRARVSGRLHRNARPARIERADLAPESPDYGKWRPVPEPYAEELTIDRG